MMSIDDAHNPPAVDPLGIKLPNGQQNLVRDLNDQLQLLFQADQGGIDTEQGISFADLISEPMTLDRCEALSAQLDPVDSSCSPAANYVRTVFMQARRWSVQ